MSQSGRVYTNGVVIHNCQRLHIDPFPQIYLTSVNPVFDGYPHYVPSNLLCFVVHISEIHIGEVQHQHRTFFAFA